MSDNRDIERLQPDKLVTHFSRTRVGYFIVLAVVIHVLVIGVTSISTIRAYLDPAYAKQLAKAEEKEQEKKSAEADKKDEGSAEGDEQEKGDDEGAATRDAEAKGAATRPSEQGGGEDKAPVEKRVSDKADPDEIPDQPDDLGLSIDDTNPEEE